MSFMALISPCVKVGTQEPLTHCPLYEACRLHRILRVPHLRAKSAGDMAPVLYTTPMSAPVLAMGKWRERKDNVDSGLGIGLVLLPGRCVCVV